MALAIVAGVILLAAFNVLHILEGALIGTILMFILKIISIREAYRDVDCASFSCWLHSFPWYCNWKIPVPPICWPTTSITRYHVSGRSLSSPVCLPSPHWLPVSCQTEPQPCCFLHCHQPGRANGIDPRPLLLTVMFAASTCYLTIRLPDQYHDPIPGNYQFKDFIEGRWCAYCHHP